MRTLFWRILGRERRMSHGQCVSCDTQLTLCHRCDGRWRAAPCDCGIGLRCPEHGRFWMR